MAYEWDELMDDGLNDLKWIMVDDAWMMVRTVDCFMVYLEDHPTDRNITNGTYYQGMILQVPSCIRKMWQATMNVDHGYHHGKWTGKHGFNAPFFSLLVFAERKNDEHWMDVVGTHVVTGADQNIEYKWMLSWSIVELLSNLIWMLRYISEGIIPCYIRRFPRGSSYNHPIFKRIFP